MEENSIDGGTLNLKASQSSINERFAYGEEARENRYT